MGVGGAKFPPPPGSLRWQEEGLERPTPPPLAEGSAPSSPGASNCHVSRTGGAPGGSRTLRGAPRQRKTGRRAAGGARGRGDLAGVSGLGCGGGGAASLVALSGLELRPGNKEGRAGV